MESFPIGENFDIVGVFYQNQSDIEVAAAAKLDRLPIVIQYRVKSQYWERELPLLGFQQFCLTKINSVNWKVLYPKQYLPIWKKRKKCLRTCLQKHLVWHNSERCLLLQKEIVLVSEMEPTLMEVVSSGGLPRDLPSTCTWCYCDTKDASNICCRRNRWDHLQLKKNRMVSVVDYSLKKCRVGNTVSSTKCIDNMLFFRNEWGITATLYWCRPYYIRKGQRQTICIGMPL